jgi:hypothetical protein
MHTRLVLALLVASVAAAPVSRANPSKVETHVVT